MKTSLSTPSPLREEEHLSQSIAFPAPQSYPTGPEAVALASYPAVQRYAVPGDAEATALSPAQAHAPAVVQRMHDPRVAPLAHQPLGKDAVMQLKFKVCGITFEDPSDYKFSPASAEAATDPIPHGILRRSLASRRAPGLRSGTSALMGPSNTRRPRATA